jgi:2-alkenal reductase
MRIAVRTVLIAIAALSGLAILFVLAMGTFTWTPARQVNAVQTTSAGALAVQPQEVMQTVPLADPAQDQLASLYEAILPSVVNIQVTQLSTIGANIMVPEAEGQGSGWVWDSEGHIVTNNHVVENANEILVYFYNGQWAEAELVAADPQADLAVLKVTPPDGITLQPLALADDVPPVGYYALAFGSPFGLAGTMTKGIISAVGRSFPVEASTTPGALYSLPEVIQTDAAINPGNSGGPLLDLNGNVIGVNFAIRSDIRANSGVGFAIPVSIVRRVVPALITQGFFSYPYLGIAGGTITPQTAEEADIPENTLGVFVSQIAGTPAQQAGIRTGDIITAIDDRDVRSFEDLISYLLTSTEPGQIVELTILRNGAVQTLPLTVGERPR